MKKHMISLLAFLFFGFLQAQKMESKLFIIGGGDTSDDLINRMLKEGGVVAGDYVAVLPNASEMPDKAFAYYKNEFAERKVGAVNCFFSKGEALSQSKLDSLKNAKMIFISGGDQTRFMEAINSNPVVKNEIYDAFHHGKMIAGTSAGAAVMSKMMITGNQLKKHKYTDTFDNLQSQNVEIKEGLGLVTNAVIDQHFVKRSRYNRLLSLIIDDPSLKGIGIDESTALLLKGRKGEVVGDGQIIVFTNPKKSQVIQQGKMGAKNIRLDIYIQGEKFNL